MNRKSLKIKFTPFVDGYYDVEVQLPEYVLRRAKSFFMKEESEKLGISDLQSLEKRRKRIGEYFLKAIGGLPKEKTPLNPEVKKTITKNKYGIEKVIYESLPNFYVTANLYIPEGLKVKTPGVLFLCGHTKPAKSYPPYQKVCIDLVKNGFTVLAIDPLGQGERLQYWDASSKKEIVRWGTTEHSFAGLQCSLIGDNIARYFIWDMIRGIDYLISRKEVDENRIGATGNSGGGTQTAYLMMVEPRVKVAAPCCYISSRDAYIKTGQAHDAEQNIFGAIKEGLNHDDFLAAFAPKPVLIGSAAYDYFCIEGAIQTYKRAKEVYSLFGAEDNVALHVGRHTHMYSDELREAVVNWFKVHLKGEQPNFKTGKIPVEPEDNLNVTRSGQILGEIPDAKTVFNLNMEHWDEKKPQRPTIKNRESLKEYVNQIRRKLQTLLAFKKTKEPIYPRIISKENIGDLSAEKIFFFSEPDIVLTAVMIQDKDVRGKTPTVLTLFEDGTNDISRENELIRKLVANAQKVFVLDVRGIGGVKVRKINPYGLTEIYGTEFKLCYDSLMLGTSLAGMRTFDVSSGIDYLLTREDVDPDQLRLYGKGQAAIYGYFAASLRPEIKGSTFEDMLYSYESIIKTRVHDRRYEERLLVHGILEHFDIVDLLPCLYGREYKFINLRNAENETLSPEELNDGWLEVLKKHYPILLGDIQEKVVLNES